LIKFFNSAILEGLRSRMVLLVMIFAFAVVLVAYLSASFSPRQPKTVALDVGLSGIRFSLVLLGLIWVHELIAQSINRRAVFFSIAQPIKRSSYLFGRFFGVVFMLVIASVVLGAMLMVVVSFSGGEYQQTFAVSQAGSYWLTMFGIALDGILVASFSLCIAGLSTVTMLPFVLGLAFAIAGKALGGVIEYLAKGADGDLSVQQLAPLIDAIQWVLPDLSRLDWRVWAMYGVPLEPVAILWSCAMAFSYIFLMLFLAKVSFERREFH
jgi:Cu-processing system permease protein